MSIFGSIMSAIFHHSAQAAPAPGGSAAKPAAPGSGAAVWLRKQVMTKLAENGGKVPDELKH
jgi:hypothetical protein